MTDPTTSQLHIIPFEPSHRASILSIWHTSVLATHQFVSAEDIRFFKDLVSSIDFATYQTHVLASPSPANPIGFLAVSNEDVPPKLEMLFILPDWTGKGLGRKAVDFAVEDLGVREVDVNEQNDKAVRFYEGMGFVTFAREERDGTGKEYPILKMRLAR